MSQETENNYKEPTDQDRLGYLKFLVDSGRFSTSKDQSYSPITDHAKIITQVEIWLCLNASTPFSVIAIRQKPEKQSPEPPKMTKEEKQQTLNKIKDLRQAVITKLCIDKKAEGPDPIGSSVYQRTISSDGGKLTMNYSIENGIDHLKIIFGKDNPTDQRRGNKKIKDFISIDNEGSFEIRMLNFKPDNTTEDFSYELSNRLSLKNPATPEVIEKVENLMNLYLQENNKDSFLKKIRQQILSKLPM